MLERRRYVRLYLPIRVEYKPLAIKNLKKSTIVRDIGGGGICLFVDSVPKEKAEASLDIYFPDGLGVLSAQGRIAWVKQEDAKVLAGVKFTNISSFDRSRIISFINSEKQRERPCVIAQTNQVVFFKETELKDKGEILELLLPNIDKVDPGLRVVDKNIDLSNSLKLDVLCLDSYGALVLIEILTEENESILVDALKHYDWAMRHMDILAKIYRLKINLNLRPRIVLMAPHFSDPFKHLVDSIATTVNILILEYVCIESRESKGIFLKKAVKPAKDIILPKDLTPHDKEEPTSTDKPDFLG
ncbi:MAG: PilZ domain-containing protein [Candidatus Omnitrophica bacterium]|nr:PilZ domain-containing protein [Candidatus Omnitrophota bacterium]MDD5236280.1 PilZ domain-containing protein [Candidatus Omnitrophota bacterium]MDD5610530.1 PilZ domain-containing protein [Candidatus Omnitrophota bacterium]